MNRRLARTASLALALSLLLLPGFSQATTRGCRPGVRAVVYAFRYVPVAPSEHARFHADVEKWAERQGLSVGGVEGGDPGQTPVYRSKISILQSEKFGILIKAETNSRSRHAKLTIGNNCWAPREAWRPWWRRLEAWVDR